MDFLSKIVACKLIIRVKEVLEWLDDIKGPLTPTPQCDLFTGLVSGFYKALRVDHLLHFVFYFPLLSFFFFFLRTSDRIVCQYHTTLPAGSKGSGVIEDSCMFLGQGPSRAGKV